MPTVLIVDDDPKLLKMLQRTLVYENLSVLTAANGWEALPLVQARQPDLIILDWMMPGMDGLTFIRRLRDEENRTMILMLTARDAIENRVEGLESGADDYLVKPFAPPSWSRVSMPCCAAWKRNPRIRRSPMPALRSIPPRGRRGAATWLCSLP